MRDPFVINMWSGPRSVSTAFMYSWRQRPDTLVYDEPFYAIYLRKFDPGHPGRDETVASMPLSYDETIDHLRAPSDRPVRYIKNIGHHLDALDTSILDEFTNVLLIRRPERVIASLAQNLGLDFDISITGLRQQVQILEHELANRRSPIVVDSHDLLTDPHRLLQALCDRLGIEFFDAMLSWTPGPKPEDGSWGKFWYQNARASSGFGKPDVSQFDREVLKHPMLPECLDMFARLEKYAVRTD